MPLPSGPGPGPGPQAARHRRGRFPLRQAGAAASFDEDLERRPPASASPEATISPARQAAQYRLLFRCSRRRAAGEPREGVQAVVRAADAVSAPPYGGRSRRGAGSSAKGGGTGTAPRPAFRRISRRGRWSAPPSRKNGAAV